MSQSPVRLALLGCSGTANATWGSLARRLAGARFSLVAEDDPERASSVAQTLLAPQTVRTAELFTSIDQYDAVVIRRPVTDVANVLSTLQNESKPILISSSAAGDLESLSPTAGGVIRICDTWRFLASTRALSEKLMSGRLGAPGLLRIHRWRHHGDGDRRHKEQPGASDHTTTHNVLFNDIDLMLSVFGELPVTTYVVERQQQDTDNDAPRYRQIHCGFADGGMALLVFTTALPAGETYDSVSLIAGAGATYFDDHHNSHLLYRGGAPQVLFSRQGEHHFVDEVQAFVDQMQGVTSDGPRLPDASNIANISLVQEDIARSLQTRQVVRRNPQASKPRV